MTTQVRSPRGAQSCIVDARIFYEEVLGLEVESVQEIASEGVKVALLPFPGGEIELLEFERRHQARFQVRWIDPAGRQGELSRFRAMVDKSRGTVSAAIQSVEQEVLRLRNELAANRRLTVFKRYFRWALRERVMRPLDRYAQSTRDGGE